MKIEELIGPELDCWVAKALGMPARLVTLETSGDRHVGEGQCWVPNYQGSDDGNQFAPSSDWAHGGPIIERERIETTPRHTSERGWFANYSPVNDGAVSVGPTPLIAAMRAYVASKYGDEVGDM